jgi:hypothetical protein
VARGPRATPRLQAITAGGAGGWSPTPTPHHRAVVGGRLTPMHLLSAGRVVGRRGCRRRSAQVPPQPPLGSPLPCGAAPSSVDANARRRGPCRCGPLCTIPPMRIPGRHRPSGTPSAQTRHSGQLCCSSFPPAPPRGCIPGHQLALHGSIEPSMPGGQPLLCSFAWTVNHILAKKK